MDVFRMRRLLLVMLGEVGRRRAHHSRGRLHLWPQWRGAVRHVRGHEGLKRLLGKGTPVILEGVRPSRT